MLDIIDGLIEQNLVGLLGVLDDRVLVLFAPQPAGTEEPYNRRDGGDEMNSISNSDHMHSIILRLQWRLARSAASLERLRRDRGCEIPTTLSRSSHTLPERRRAGSRA